MDPRFQPISWLQKKKFQAYLVGNQARNNLLGVKYDPKDIDIATSALPDQIITILRDQGIIPGVVDDQFGVVTFQWQGNEYEVTTFRKDIYDTQFNHIRRTPSSIEFIDDVKQDAQRRDLTINAIYWDPASEQYLDPVSGKKDLKDGVIRFVGDPEIRIKEDPIRVLRAVRFKFSLGFKYDPKTRKALKELGHMVHKISAPSLKKEYQKIQNLPNYHLARKELRLFGVLPRL